MIIHKLSLLFNLSSKWENPMNIKEINASITTQTKKCLSKWGEITLEGLPAEIPQNSPLVKEFKNSVHDVTGIYPQIIGFKGWSDTALFINEAGVPAINFGLP